MIRRRKIIRANAGPAHMQGGRAAHRPARPGHAAGGQAAGCRAVQVPTVHALNVCRVSALAGGWFLVGLGSLGWDLGRAAVGDAECEGAVVASDDHVLCGPQAAIEQHR